MTWVNKKFKPGNGLLFFFIPLIVIAFIVSFFSVSSDGWYALFYGCFGVFGILAVIELKTSYIEMTEHDLVIKSQFKTTRIRKSEIIKVTWEKGVGASVLLTNEQWHHLPDFAHPQSICQTISKWL